MESIPNNPQRRRLFTLRYQGHKITYSHAMKKLTVDGQEYSTADGQVSLLVKENGKVEWVNKNRLVSSIQGNCGFYDATT
jgi:hypothetical protein